LLEITEKNDFVRITGEPVITGKKFTITNLVKIQMQKTVCRYLVLGTALRTDTPLMGQSKKRPLGERIFSKN
jgi:hypothetical protein